MVLYSEVQVPSLQIILWPFIALWSCWFAAIFYVLLSVKLSHCLSVNNFPSFYYVA